MNPGSQRGGSNSGSSPQWLSLTQPGQGQRSQPWPTLELRYFSSDAVVLSRPTLRDPRSRLQPARLSVVGLPRQEPPGGLRFTFPRIFPAQDRTRASASHLCRPRTCAAASTCLR